jgi:hypothetical protein
MAIISNLPTIILTIRRAFDARSKSRLVIPVLSPVVVRAETDSKIESIKLYFEK